MRKFKLTDKVLINRTSFNGQFVYIPGEVVSIEKLGNNTFYGVKCKFMQIIASEKEIEFDRNQTILNRVK